MAGPKVIKSLERGLRVLQALQMQPDSSLQQLYVFTGISKPSLLRILHTLARSGVVTRRLADGRYRIQNAPAGSWTLPGAWKQKRWVCHHTQPFLPAGEAKTTV